MTIARLGLKVEVTGQYQGLKLGLGLMAIRVHFHCHVLSCERRSACAAEVSEAESSECGRGNGARGIEDRVTKRDMTRLYEMNQDLTDTGAF